MELAGSLSAAALPPMGKEVCLQGADSRTLWETQVDLFARAHPVGSRITLEVGKRFVVL